VTPGDDDEADDAEVNTVAESATAIAVAVSTRTQRAIEIWSLRCIVAPLSMSFSAACSSP
jgi:hypothetical protein